MMEPNKNLPLCGNGHQQPNPDSRFCIYCGIPLNTQNSPNNGAQAFQPPQNSNGSPQNQYAQPVQPVQYMQPVQNQAIISMTQTKQCQKCGGNGQWLDAQSLTCSQCRWLRPLTLGYSVDCSAFQWAEDGKAMATLRALTPLHSIAQTISNKVGRRWIESTFNGVLLSEKQLPEVYAQAIQAARILGMSHMPDVYVSGEVMWDCRTYGSDHDSFIVIGTALATNFRAEELLFLFAREMGHCRAGHALWKTVIKFLLGEQGPRKGLMAGGLFAALSPSALIEGALEMPLLAWARQAEITADRAGLLAIGDEEIARRVLLSWSLKSPFLYRQINIAAWLEQQSASYDDMTRLSELTTSSTPYITRRLKLMAEFAQSPDLLRWRSVISQYIPKVTPPPVQPNPPQPTAKPTAPPPNTDLKMKCAGCQTPMRIPQKVLEGKEQMAIRCPNPQCEFVTRLKLKKKPANAAAPATAANPVNNLITNVPNKKERDMTYDD